MAHLHYATRTGNYAEVGVCLSQGDDVNTIGIRHLTPLMIAAQEGHLDIVRLLLKAGADVRLTLPNRRTALHLATDKGNPEIIKALVAHGADVNARSKHGETPAIEAAKSNRIAVVDLLKMLGADPEIRDKNEMTADDCLAKGGRFGKPKERMQELEERFRAGHEAKLRKIMASGLSADEFAAKHGRNILVWSYNYRYIADPEVQQWARRIAQIIIERDPNYDPELLERCEEQYLEGEELEEARKQRAQRAKRAARNAKRKRAC